MGHAAVCEALGAAPPAVSAPEGKTLLLCPKACEDHQTAASLARDADDVPPENVDRLRVLTDSADGIFQHREFAHRTVTEDCERAAAMVDVLRVHEYTYIKKIQAREVKSRALLAHETCLSPGLLCAQPAGLQHLAAGRSVAKAACGVGDPSRAD